MNYKRLYQELAQKITGLNITVCDHDFLGYCYQTGPERGFIVIKPDLSYKEKYFVLCHEMGHLFYMKKDKKIRWSKKPRTEEEANSFALRLIKSNKIGSHEYHKLYAKARRIVKKRKKSWFEF